MKLVAVGKPVTVNKFIRSVSVVSALLFLVALGSLAIACEPGTETGGKIGVVVSIAPQAEFVEKVGGERVSVSVMVPPGANLHTYEPAPSQVEVLSRSQVYVKVGSGIEFELAWMDKLADINRKMLIVDSSKGVELIEGVEEEDDEDSHGLMDSHIWLSPLNVKIMVNNIYEGLAQIDPGSRAYYERNRDAYLQELTELDREIRDSLSGITNRRFMVYHSAWGYFAREYGLTMLPIEAEGKEPTAAGIAHLIDQARQHNTKVVFASPQYNPQSARTIAQAIGGSVIMIDQLAGNYVANLRSVLAEMVQAME